MTANTCPHEQAEQQTLAAWLDWHGIRWCHIPNEGKKTVAYHAKMKRQGLKSGVPDVLIFDPPPMYPADFVGAVIELKRVKGGTVSPEQRYWLAELELRRWKCTVAKGAGAAIEWLESLGYGKK